MILTTSYRGRRGIKRDLLAGFSAIDYPTSGGMDAPDLDRAFLRLLIRLSSLCSLHGPQVARDLVNALEGSDDPFSLVSNTLETGAVTEPDPSSFSRELQQEIVHFSRIVDVGRDGFGRPPAAGIKRVRRSSRLPAELKVLSELMIVARGRLAQRGRDITRAASRRPGTAKSEPYPGVLIQRPEHSDDFVLVLASGRRRLRLETAFYFGNLLAYLPPGDAFAVLAAHLAETAPQSGLRMFLAAADNPGRLAVRYWGAIPAVPEDPFDAARQLLPRADEITIPRDRLSPVSAAADAIRLEYRGGTAMIAVRSDDGSWPAAVSSPLRALSDAGSADLGDLARRAAQALDAGLRSGRVLSVECGHIHLDRSLDVDQEAGARIGAAVYQALSGRQPAPLLAPMMDDDHVLVRLRPAEYAAFLGRHFPDVLFRLIPESSPVIRAIAVALYARLASSDAADLLAVRGRNLFLRLSGGSACELFEDFEGSPVTGCVLFESALLVYRTDPEAFDAYAVRRFPGEDDVHLAAARILDTREPHDTKARRLAGLYERFSAITDPADPDPGFSDLVARVLAEVPAGTAHLNVLEDYYEVQQSKVRELLAVLGLPFRLVTLFFNTQSGRVSIGG